MKTVEGLKPWEVMQQHMEEGERVAFTSSRQPGWRNTITPLWDWSNKAYAIIDDTAPVIDWEGVISAMKVACDLQGCANCELKNINGICPVFVISQKLTGRVL